MYPSYYVHLLGVFSFITDINNSIRSSCIISSPDCTMHITVNYVIIAPIATGNG